LCDEETYNHARGSGNYPGHSHRTMPQNIFHRTIRRRTFYGHFIPFPENPSPVIPQTVLSVYPTPPLQICIPVSRVMQRTGGLLFVVHYAALIAKYAIWTTCISHTRCHLSTDSFIKKHDIKKSKMIFKPGGLSILSQTRCSAIAERPRCRVRYSFRQK